MRAGEVVARDIGDLDAARRRCREDLARLPEVLLREGAPPRAARFEPVVAPALRRLADEVDRRIAMAQGTP
jgi:hypothetical protein